MPHQRALLGSSTAYAHPRRRDLRRRAAVGLVAVPRSTMRSSGHLTALLLVACVAFAQCLDQQSQHDDGWDIDAYEQPEAVPSIAAVRRMLQAVSGSYYGNNEYGGYGYYSNNEAGTYGYDGSSTGFGTRRSLMATSTGSYGGYYGNNELGGYYGNNEMGGYGNYGSSSSAMSGPRSMLQLDGGAKPVQQVAAETGPVGQCYCRYESDYNTWALGEEACKNALYAKCKADSRLPCGWLDDYYGTSAFGSQRTGYGLPHESQISAFLFEDCTPMPPCGCSNIAFDGRDDAALSYKCCRDMRVHCRHPASGLSCAAVTAYCNNDKPSFHLAMWVDRALESAQCDAYHGRPYTFVPYEQLAAAAAQMVVTKPATRGKASVPAASEVQGATEQEVAASAQQSAAITPASGISIDVGSVLMVVGGGLVAAALVAAALAVRRQRQARMAVYQPLLDEHVVAERGMGGQAIMGGLRQPPSAVIGAPGSN